MEKALREAKRNTNWVEPNDRLGGGGQALLPRALLSTSSSCADFEPFVARVAAVGERAALGQLVLKLTAPGVPDIYQGDELAYRALVDPDNRRPVDLGWRQAMLRRLMGGSPPDGETRKLWLILRLLGLRAAAPSSSAPARRRYEPLEAGDAVCAFGAANSCWWRLPSGPEPAGDAQIDAPPGAGGMSCAGRSDLVGPTAARRLLSQRGLAVFERL